MKTCLFSSQALVASSAALLLLAFSSLPGAEATTLVRHVSAVIGNRQMAMPSTHVHSQTTQRFRQADQYGSYVDTQCCNNSPMDGVPTFVAEPGCKAGYMCYMGKARNTVPCIEGMLYDESIGNCNWASVTQCISSCPGSNGIVVSPTPPPIAPPSCPVGTDNLGPQLSASDYKGEFGLLRVTNELLSPVGRESQLSLLVGGNYDGPLAAEIEGRIVVLGDFKIGQRGVNSLGTSGATMCQFMTGMDPLIDSYILTSITRHFS